MKRRIELAASVRNKKIKALINTMEKRIEFSVASVINQKIEPNWEIAIQRGQTDIIECDIKKTEILQPI